MKRAMAWVWLAAGMMAMTGAAWGSGGSDKPATGPQYVELKPAFVANYGGPGAMRYVKADLAVRVEGGEAMAKVEHHAPQLRHHLVMLLSRQTDESLSTPEGKEALRQEALTAIRQVFEQEEGKPLVEDLLFTSLIVQR